jgi:hypothetical protein
MLLIFFIYISLLPAGCAILLLLAKPQKYCHWAGAHRCCLLGTGQRGAVISSVPKSRSLLTLYLLVAFDAFWILLGGFDGQREFVSPKNSAKQRPFAKKTE